MSKDNSYYTLAKVSQLGFQMIASMIISVLIGIFLDNKFDTKPTYTVIFIFFGLATCLRNLYVFVKKYD